MARFTSEDKKLEWKTLIEQQRQSGLSIDKWCLQNHIRPNTFYYWKLKFFPKELHKSSFTELNVKRPDAISLQSRGLHIRIGSDCDPYLRKQLFTLFSELSC